MNTSNATFDLAETFFQTPASEIFLPKIFLTKV